MCKKLLYLTCLSLVLGLFMPNLTNATDESLVGWWMLDEGSGDRAADSSGYGNNGTLFGPNWVVGQIKGALSFSGQSYVEVPDAPSLNSFGNTVTISAWISANSLGNWRGILVKGGIPVVASPGLDEAPFAMQMWGDGALRFAANWGQPAGGTGNGTWNSSNLRIPVGQWAHVAITYDGSTIRFFIDGEMDPEEVPQELVFGTTDQPLSLGVDWPGGDEFYDGAMDDVRLYSRALTQEELRIVMTGAPLTTPPHATFPNPEDGSVDVPRDDDLSWEPGPFDVTHDVYFGSGFDDINDATTDSAVYQGRQSETIYVLDRLELGQTYYWRIDEVNAPPDNTIFKGSIWSFTTEPVGYQIVDVNATASSSNAINEGPENTINGSGLDDDDLHSAMNIDMWLSSTIGPQPAWIQYDFDRVYKLHQMLVWNYNTSVEPVIGFGIKEATIEYSADGTSWTTLGTHEFARALGAAGYAANTTVDLSGVVAKYVKITANSNWGGFMPQFGLSEIRFFYLPVLAREPDPASRATDIDVDNVTLSWRAGREAASHEVYFSDSNQAVIDSNTPVVSVSEASYDAGELQLNQSYYWKVNEVNEAETPTTWEGNVWNFTTCEFLVVEDFEDYNNFSPYRVFQRWIDGIGYSADEFFPVDNPGNGSGAAIGHDIWSYDSPHYDGDIMETTIVHGGAQSASIGFERIGAVGGSGVVYFDDISLYPYSRQLITPAEPDTASLVAHYEFEGTTNDSSSNGRNGTAVGDPIFVAGKIGQAISLDGIGDYVEITGYKGILGPNAITVTAWINTTATETGAIIGWGPNVGGQRFGFRIDDGRLRTEHHGGNVQGDTNVNDGEWHHVAVTVQENATISYPEVVLYLNGQDDTRPGTSPNAFALTADQDVSIGRRPASDDRYFMGQIDDVRIYERVLSQEEISWLAGRTKPFDKPF